MGAFAASTQMPFQTHPVALEENGANLQANTQIFTFWILRQKRFWSLVPCQQHLQDGLVLRCLSDD